MSTNDARPTFHIVHTDQCLADVRTYGFCEHETLPRPRLRTHSPRPPHPVRTELLATLGLLAVAGGTIALSIQFGFTGLALGAGVGLGWIILAGTGMPQWLMADLSKVLPPDAREKLGF